MERLEDQIFDDTAGDQFPVRLYIKYKPPNGFYEKILSKAAEFTQEVFSCTKTFAF